jgi:DNA-binding PadR family transcriptional regulator
MSHTDAPPLLVRSPRDSSRAAALTDPPDLLYCTEQMGRRTDLLGSLEQIVLLALVRLGANAYGMTVRLEIEKRTGRSLSIGAIYATLERLEGKGYVSSFTGEPTAARGGRAKRFFRIEAEGMRALRASQRVIENMSVGLKKRLQAT